MIIFLTYHSFTLIFLLGIFKSGINSVVPSKYETANVAYNKPT